MPYAAPNQSISVVSHPASGQPYAIGYSPRVPCYGLAALFALFAFLYPIGYIPFTRTLMRWHFWLSLGSVAWLTVGFVVLGIAGERQASSQPFGVIATLLTFSFLAAIPVFVAAQVWFLVDLVRALIIMRQPG
jgi:hypothetical protein